MPLKGLAMNSDDHVQTRICEEMLFAAPAAEGEHVLSVG